MVNALPNIPLIARYFTYFLSGMTVFYYFESIFRFRWYILGIGIGLIGLEAYMNNEWAVGLIQGIEPYLFSGSLVAFAYIATFLNGFRKLENITYGMYLYHFPVIQVLIHFHLHEYNLWLCLVVGLILTLILASASWFFIEKPLMEKYK